MKGLTHPPWLAHSSCLQLPPGRAFLPHWSLPGCVSGCPGPSTEGSQSVPPSPVLSHLVSAVPRLLPGSSRSAPTRQMVILSSCDWVFFKFWQLFWSRPPLPPFPALHSLTPLPGTRSTRFLQPLVACFSVGCRRLAVSHVGQHWLLHWCPASPRASNGTNTSQSGWVVPQLRSTHPLHIRWWPWAQEHPAVPQ